MRISMYVAVCVFCVAQCHGQKLNSTRPPPPSWEDYATAMANVSYGLRILVIFHDFPYTDEFHRRFPNQLVMSSPRRDFGVCPHERILVLTGQSPSEFRKRSKFFMRAFRICPYGAAF